MLSSAAAPSPPAGAAPAAAPAPAAPAPAAEEPVAAAASTSTPVDAATPTPAAAELPPVPDATITDAVAGLAAPDAVVAPLQYGDLSALGLLSWTPAGLTRAVLEFAHIGAALPWAWAIVATTVAVRAAILPVQVLALRSQLALQPLAPQMNKLKEEAAAARAAKDTLGMQRAMLKHQQLIKSAGVSMWPVAVAPLVMLPTQLGLFFAVKKLCDLPLPQLADSGVSWVGDLTMADPVTAVAATAAIQLSMMVAKRDIVTEDSGHILNFFQAFSLFGGTWFLWGLPAGVNVMITTGALFQAAQGTILHMPPMRRILGLPKVDEAARARRPRFAELIPRIKKYYADKAEETAKARKAELSRKRA